VTVSRSRSINGPWAHAPNNPLVRTVDDREQWWSRGHATIFEGPGGNWWMVYHGYENGFRTLGRQTLLDPVEWSADGWPQARGGDLSKPLNKPKAAAQTKPQGLALSDDFQTLRMGSVWTFYRPAATEIQRIQHQPGHLLVQGKGMGPEDSSPLCVNVGDHAYEVSVDIELLGAAKGGLLLFYSRHLFCGMGFDGTRMSTYRGGADAGFWREPAPTARRMQLKIVNDRHIVTLYYRAGDTPWQRHGLRMEVSGYHVNASDELTCLRPALMSAGTGDVVFRNFQYRALAA
jgi:xylan 1,4-beta-xylosidase